VPLWAVQLELLVLDDYFDLLRLETEIVAGLHALCQSVGLTGILVLRVMQLAVILVFSYYDALPLLVVLFRYYC